MNLLHTGQRKISTLFAACFFSILVLSIAFSSVVIYRLSQLESRARTLYAHSLAISEAGQDMLADVSRMHNLMLQATLAPVAGAPIPQDTALQDLDAGFRRNLAIVTAEAEDAPATRDNITRQLDAWHADYARMLGLIRGGQRKQALAIGMGSGVQAYRRLDADVTTLLQQARTRTFEMADSASHSAAEAIREAWWILGTLAFFNALCGVTVLRRISRIMKDDARLVTRLQDNEQRLKMALSGGNQGTWDLEVDTGRLTFDAGWGTILGYSDAQERPANMEQWAASIYSEDRERVLKAMDEHIAGHTTEYRAEYRMRGKDGELKWVAGHGKAMLRDSNNIATRVVGITQDITQRKQSEQKIWNLAHTDILTGLPNRVLLYDRLTQIIAYAKRHEQMFALFFLDLDGFKEVNDKYGHDIGDKLLQEVAKRLGEVIRSEDTMARVGGDEFIFVLSGIHAREDAAALAEKIISLLGDEFFIDDCRCKIGGSIGIALFPEHGETMDSLVSRADDAMYQAKGKGKNTFKFYEAGEDAASAA